VQHTSYNAAGDEVDEHAEAPRASEAGRYDAFLSYAREDSEFVINRLCAELRERGKDVWVDIDITGGARWQGRVKRGIEACKAFVFVITPASVTSVACQHELEDAVALNKLVIPVVHRDDYQEPLPPALADAEWVFLRDADDPEVGMARLVEALESDLEWRDRHTRLAGRAREWMDAGRDRAYLLRGSDLRDAEAWLSEQEGHREAPTREQSEYIVRSRQAAGRRLYTLIGGLAAGFAIAVGLLIFALIQRSQARHQASVAQSRQFAALAEAGIASDPQQSIRSAARGVQIQRTTQATHSLWHALIGSRLRAQFQEPSGIRSVIFSPDGSELAVGSDDGAVRLWRVADRRLLWTQGRGQQPATSMSFARSGDLLVVGRSPSSSERSGCSVQVLNASTGKLQRQLGEMGAPGCRRFVAFVGSSRFVAVADEAGTVQFWNVDAGTLTTTGNLLTAENIPAVGLAVSRDGGLLSLAGLHVVRVINLRTGRNVTSIQRSASGIFNPTGLALSPDGNNLLVSGEYAAEIYGLATFNRSVHTELYAQGAATGSPAWSTDGRLVAAEAGPAGVDVWDASSGRVIVALRGSSAGSFSALAFSPADLLAGGSTDGSVRVWAPDSDLPQRVVPANSSSAWAGGAAFAHLVILGDARRLIVLNDEGGTVARLALNGAGPIGVSPTGQLAYTAGGVLQERQLPSGRAVRSWRLPFSSSPAGVAVARGGTTAAVIASDGRLGVFSGTRTRTTVVPTAPFPDEPDMSMSPDGRLLAVTGPRGVRILNTQNLRVVHSEGGSAVSFSPSGALVAIQRPDLSVAVLRTSDWGVQSVERGEPTRAAISFSPDGRLLAATATDAILRVWDDRDGTLLSSTHVEESALATARLGISAPVLTAAGTAVVSANGAANLYMVCPDCLDPTALLKQAAARTKATRPVVAP
jgi:WD40 repeat protein